MAIRLAVGYQLPDEDEPPFADLIADYREHIAELYFPWLNMPSGRSPISVREGFTDWEAQAKLEEDLRACRKLGIRLDLLLNANCYGALSLSQELENYTLSVIEHLGEVAGLDLVTTTSLMLARAVKQAFPDLEVRASVNMRLGTVRALEPVAEYFDSFYVQREYNRRFDRIAELKTWADTEGKGLHLLVNSGCLNFCPGQTFHDNLVAHEAEISRMRNVEGWNPHVCWNFYQQREHWVRFLQNSWIRPEDLDRYEGLIGVAKLATRQHANPRRVVHAYATRRFAGNLPDLLEPGHAPLFAPYVLDASRLPADWFEQTTSCLQRCQDCTYCATVLEQILTLPSGQSPFSQTSLAEGP